MPCHVYVVGSLNEDLVLKVDRIPTPGETVLAHAASRGAGGKGANQAVAAARAGAAARMVGCVGADGAGTRLVAALASEGVGTTGITTVEQTTGMAVVSVAADGENAIVVLEGASTACTPAVVANGLTSLQPGDLVVTQAEIPAAAIEEAATLARAAGATFVLNLAPPRADLSPEHVTVDVLVVNEHEARVVAQRQGCRSSDVEDMARHLADSWSATVIVTLGAAGAYLTAPGTPVMRLAAYEAVQVVDTTGAGDAFVGALAAALGARRGPVEAVRCGLAAGAIAVESPGAQGAHATPKLIALRMSTPTH